MGSAKVCVVVYRFAWSVCCCLQVCMGSAKVCVVVYRSAWEVLKCVLLCTGVHGKC
jgi:hypothetical protein